MALGTWKYSSFAVAIAVVGLIACGKGTRQGVGQMDLSVIDGQVISVDQRVRNLPSVSVVRVHHFQDGGGVGKCTGVLVDKRFVLTAGHCLGGAGSRKIIRVEFEFTPESEKMVRVSGYYVHEVYQVTRNKSDLALLMLERDAPRGYAAAPLFQPSIWERLGSDQGGYAEYYGYGCGSRPYTVGSDCDHGTLRRGFTNQAIFFDKMISWKVGQGFVCGGDSGGPAFVYRNNQFYVAGIASHILENLSPELRQELYGFYGGDKWEFYKAHPEISECSGQASYTDVSKYIKWIRNAQATLRAETK